MYGKWIAVLMLARRIHDPPQPVLYAVLYFYISFFRVLFFVVMCTGHNMCIHNINNENFNIY